MEIISTILAIIISCVSIGGFIIKKLDTIIDNKLKPIEESINELGINDCKNYLVSYLACLELGKEVTEDETKRAFEMYDKYTLEYHQNSFVKRKWQKLVVELCLHEKKNNQRKEMWLWKIGKKIGKT